MKQKDQDRPSEDSATAIDDGLGRRMFLQRSSGLALGFLAADAIPAGAQEIKPKPKAAAAPAAPEKPPTPVTCAVIGLGDQGREILKALSVLPGADVKLVCDSYATIHKRALERAPKATAVEDYRKVLDDKSVAAVWVATPSHLHKDIVLAALQAGKAVYCEAPLASNISDARAIAQAALRAPKQVFQAGLQRRLNPLEQHVGGFFRTGVLSKIAQGRSTWNKKTSWRRAASTPERQTQLDWRLSSKTSGGLLGEVGIHQIDVASWFLRGRPLSVSGSGAVMVWKDGRDVADTVQCSFEFPGGVRYAFNATLANSFDGMSDIFQGTDAAVMVRSERAWMFKESDAPNLGWEVYATKENIGDETGIALVANATKLLDEGLDPAENRNAYTKGALFYACEAFLNAVRGQTKTTAGPVEGFEATVVALKAHEAVATGTKIMLGKELFALA
jgi:predicted dehydrogenase